jgi:hypothetical protein
MTKKVNKKEKADLGQHHSGVPFERIHMGILGPLPVSKLGNKYILVIIDQFTKWIECYPLPNQYAETIAKALMDSTISRFGYSEISPFSAIFNPRTKSIGWPFSLPKSITFGVKPVCLFSVDLMAPVNCCK